MKTLFSKNPQSAILSHRRAAQGFTLMETVIAIGVLAILLTGFLAVFTPAAQGIRRSISAQQADRLASTLERELVTLRAAQNPTSATTGFGKAFEWIRNGTNSSNAIFVYQYRGNSANLRADGTPTPMPGNSGQPGVDYVVQSMARRLDDSFLQADLGALEGAVFFVKPTQLVLTNNQMTVGTAGIIRNPLPTGGNASDALSYADAVIAFSAEFHSVPTKSYAYLSGTQFATRFNTTKRPVFTRNLAVRR